jgi:HSP20 family protein
MQNEDKEFFEKLANYAEEVQPDYEIKFAKASKTANAKLNISTNYDEYEEDFDENEGELAIDVYETPDELVIESPIAGVSGDDIDINITNDSVTIKGKRRRPREPLQRNYLYQECFWGKFSKHIVLPQEIDPEKAEATFKNGVLKINLPKVNRQKAKKIKIKTE